MTEPNPGVIAYLEQLQAYYEDASQAPHENRPRPPTTEITIELVAAVAQLAAIAIDFERTGEVNLEPSPEAKLRAAEMIDERLA